MELVWKAAAMVLMPMALAAREAPVMCVRIVPIRILAVQGVIRRRAHMAPIQILPARGMGGLRVKIVLM